MISSLSGVLLYGSGFLFQLLFGGLMPTGQLTVLFADTLFLDFGERPLEQLFLLPPGASTQGANVQQRNHNRAKCEHKSNRPVADIKPTLEQRFKKCLAPNEHSCG